MGEGENNNSLRTASMRTRTGGGSKKKRDPRIRPAGIFGHGVEQLTLAPAAAGNMQRECEIYIIIYFSMVNA